jgi:formylglycine-generating enzyme required for sulfatase activity
MIQAGTFLMGSDSSHPALDMARPAHTVSVDSFCMGTHEVTVLEYADCSHQGACEAAHSTGKAEPDTSNDAKASPADALDAEQCNPGKPGREHHPVNCVSHRQAASYCAFRGARLPTEAEWEFAARGPANRLFPWGDAPLTAERANACGKECQRWHLSVGLENKLQGLMYDQDDGHANSAPVGSFPTGSTREGVMDLIGNVFEWTAGGLYTYDRQARTNPTGPTHTDAFVIRGGNFNSGISEFADAALRFAMDAQAYSHGVGFRCADDPEPSSNAAEPRFQARSGSALPTHDLLE